MKTLKELYWNKVGYMSKRLEAKMNRKGMVYMAKYFDGITADKFDYNYLGKLLQSEGICQGCLPQRVYLNVETGTLVIVHVKNTTKMYEALRNIGFEE